ECTFLSLPPAGSLDTQGPPPTTAGTTCPAVALGLPGHAGAAPHGGAPCDPSPPRPPGTGQGRGPPARTPPLRSTTEPSHRQPPALCQRGGTGEDGEHRRPDEAADGRARGRQRSAARSAPGRGSGGVPRRVGGRLLRGGLLRRRLLRRLRCGLRLGQRLV